MRRTITILAALVSALSGWTQQHPVMSTKSHSLSVGGQDYVCMESIACADEGRTVVERSMVVYPRSIASRIGVGIGASVGAGVEMFEVTIGDRRLFVAPSQLVVVIDSGQDGEVFIGPLASGEVELNAVTDAVAKAIERTRREKNKERSRKGEPGATDNPGNAQ